MTIATERPILLIALPFSEIPKGRFPNKLVRFGRVLQKLLPSHEIRFSWTPNTLGAHALNLAIDEFRLDPKNEWLFFWDTKVDIKPRDIVTMVGCKVGVVGALYESGGIESQWKASFFPDMKADPTLQLLAVPELEAGAKLYHRSVFDVIEKKRTDLHYIFDNSGRSIPAFCQEAPVNFGEYKRMITPAKFLDALCREAGIWIYAHIGVMLFKGKGPYRPWEHTREPPPVCAEELPEAPEDKRGIKVFIPYCLKDQKKAEDLKFYLEDSCGYLADLIYSHGDKYPKGPNDTALMIMREVAFQLTEFGQYKAILMMEPDCCPMTEDWLDDLSASWDRAAASGKLIMGSWHPINIDHPTLGHINGNLIFSPDLAKRITIPDVPDDKPWDTFLADVFAPHWCRTGLIKNLNRHRTASRDQLTKPECGTRPPVLVHGVRDSSSWDLARENYENTNKQNGTAPVS